MILKRVGPFSCAKVSAILYCAMGLIIGLIFSMFSLFFAATGFGPPDSGRMFGIIFGVGAVIILPIFYGCLGFVAGALTAWIYNMIAKYAGGIEMDFEDDRPMAASPPTGQMPPV